MRPAAALACLVLLGHAGAARADDDALVGDDLEVQVHGQASQGWLRTLGNQYFGATDQGIGSFEMNEFLLNATTRTSGRVGAGIQLISQDLGLYGNSVVQVDWARGTYRVSDALVISAGRMRVPMGLYGATRDVDAARTGILLSQAVYNEGYRDFESTISGLGLHGDIALGGGSLTYDFQAGVKQIPGGSISLAMLERLNLFSTTRLVSAGTAVAAAVVWSPPVDGLRLGLSMQVATNVDASGKPGSLFSWIDREIGDGTFDPASASGSIRLQYPKAVLSAEYAPGPFVVGFEAQGTVPFVSFGGLNLADPALALWGARYIPIPTAGAQLFASTRATDWCELALRLDAMGRFVPGTGAGPTNDDDHYASATFSARFDPAPRWVVKLEAQYAHGYANILSPTTNTSTHWAVFGAKATYWF